MESCKLVEQIGFFQNAQKHSFLNDHCKHKKIKKIKFRLVFVKKV
jgi:hypothetical protein